MVCISKEDGFGDWKRVGQEHHFVSIVSEIGNNRRNGEELLGVSLICLGMNGMASYRLKHLWPPGNPLLVFSFLSPFHQIVVASGLNTLFWEDNWCLNFHFICPFLNC